MALTKEQQASWDRLSYEPPTLVDRIEIARRYNLPLSAALELSDTVVDAFKEDMRESNVS